MLREQTTSNVSKQSSRCKERVLDKKYGKGFSTTEKRDNEIKTDVSNALWKNDILRTLDFQQIDIHVKNGVVTLDGHITSSRSQNQVGDALRTISGLIEIKNNLVSDEKLTLDVAGALAVLEHEYGCKFFTGASHGIVTISGTVSNENIKLLAEKYASDTPDTRGVINNIQIEGKRDELKNTPFIQPVIGEEIYFLDWVSGIVKQVIMNPNNRRVIAMTIFGKFPSRVSNDKNEFLERLIVIPIKTVRYLTNTSGFLYIKSDQKSEYMDFMSGHFSALPRGWSPPYSYCPEDVLFPENNDEKDT